MLNGLVNDVKWVCETDLKLDQYKSAFFSHLFKRGSNNLNHIKMYSNLLWLIIVTKLYLQKTTMEQEQNSLGRL